MNRLGQDEIEAEFRCALRTMELRSSLFQQHLDLTRLRLDLAFDDVMSALGIPT